MEKDFGTVTAEGFIFAAHLAPLNSPAPDFVGRG